MSINRTHSLFSSLSVDSIAMIARTKSIFHLQNNLIHAIEIMCNNCCAKYTDVDIIFHICIFHCMKNNVYNYFILFFYYIYIYIDYFHSSDNCDLSFKLKKHIQTMLL